MKDTRFSLEAELMLRTIPSVARERCFALKVGTAINLFVRDFPRLSVDIDLVYLPLENRERSLAEISAALDRIEAALAKAFRYPVHAVNRIVEQARRDKVTCL